MKFYRPEIDGLRFFAFLLVFSNHTLQYASGGSHRRLPVWLGESIGTVATAGAFGVDLFFTISSFLITSLLLRECEAYGRLDIPRFYARRGLRIWPVYFTVTLVAWAASFVVPGEQFPPGLLAAYLLFVGNWPFVFALVPTIAAPLWSVAIEEQFYLLWPWVVRGGRATTVLRASLALLVVSIVACAVVQWLAPGEDWVTRNSFTRIDGIAIGAVLAIASGRRAWRGSTTQRVLLLAAGLAALLLAARAFGLFERPIPTWQLAGGWLFVALSCGTILAAVLDSTGPLRSLFAHPVLVYLGRISYGLYAYHELAIRVADGLFPEHARQVGAFLAHECFSLGASVVLAMLSYRYLETPFMRLKQRFTVVASRPV